MSSPAQPRYVLDTSIAVKWYLPDEDHGQEADTLLTQFLTGQVDLIAPSHINYEMSNVMWTAVRRGRVPEELARDALVEFLSLPIDRVGANGSRWKDSMLGAPMVVLRTTDSISRWRHVSPSHFCMQTIV